MLLDSFPSSNDFNVFAKWRTNQTDRPSDMGKMYDSKE